MRFFFLYFFYGVISLVLQETFFASFPFQTVRFDFLFMAVMTLAFTTETKRALPLILFFGALTDAVSVAPFGMSILSYSAVYFMMRGIIAQISFHAGFGRFVWGALMSLVDKVVCAFLLLLWTQKFSLFLIWITESFSQALCDATLALFFVPFLTWYSDVSLEKLTKTRKLIMK